LALVVEDEHLFDLVPDLFGDTVEHLPERRHRVVGDDENGNALPGFGARSNGKRRSGVGTRGSGGHKSPLRAADPRLYLEIRPRAKSTPERATSLGLEHKTRLFQRSASRSSVASRFR